MAADVSVVVPTLDRRVLVERAVNSVLAQDTDRLLECIVVDDGSTDGTLEWAAEHPDARVRFEQTEGRQGAAAARNVGLERATGRFLAFCDSDDEWLPLHLRTALSALDGTAGAVVCGMLVVRDGRQSPAHARLGNDAFESLLRFAEPLTTTGIVVDRDAFETPVRFDERFPAMQDRQLLLTLAAAAPVVSVPGPTYRWHWHDGPRITDSSRHVAARRLLLEVHGDALRSRPDAQSLHWMRLARVQRRIGDRAGAGASLAQAARSAPLPLRWRLHALRAATGAGRLASAAGWRVIGV